MLKLSGLTKVIQGFRSDSPTFTSFNSLKPRSWHDRTEPQQSPFCRISSRVSDDLNSTSQSAEKDDAVEEIPFSAHVL